MALGPLIFLAVLALVHHPLMVSDDTDPATVDRLQEHEHRMKQEMGRLQVEYDQKEWSWDPRQSWEHWTSSDLPAEDGTWDGWHYVALIILILFGYSQYSVEKEPSDDSSTDSSGSTITTEEENDDDDEAEPDIYGSNRLMLERFYNRHVKMETGDLNSTCDFVTSFVDRLLEACRRALPDQNALPLLENCIGVGSAFEGWHTQLSKTYTVLVPVLPPRGRSFQIETSDPEGTLSRHGRILVKMECTCKRERLLGDVVCLLHHPKRQPSDGTQVLCTGSLLDAEKTIHWFQELVAKAWNEIYQSYSLDLVSQPSNTACRLKLGFRSGKSISIDIILGVQQGDSSVFLVTQGGEMDRTPSIIWREIFAVQELLFFEWVRRRLPEDSCHLKCLQLLTYFRESRSSERKPVLTDYHFKTSLMHLLLLRSPSAWEPENFGPALRDILSYLHTALQRKHLPHFMIGNHSLPIRIPLPRDLRSAAPRNLFEPLAADPGLHAEALKEFAEVAECVEDLWSKREE
uniref:Inositol 1,4,5-trisphosphate receptor-interacting protein-like 1 n=1 Tax=Pogona vitticeps TaxID=103695 RepID=A0ABM5EQ82_9SAUR